MRVLGVILGLLMATPALAAGETLPSFGLTSGASPNTLCIFDKSATRPCVAIGSLDSVLHKYTSTPFALSTTQDGFSWNSLLGTRVINAHMTNAFGTLTGSGISAVYLFNVDSENINATSSGGIYNMYVGTNIGGNSSKGNRNGISSILAVSSTTGNTVTATFYTAMEAYAIASANDNGDGVTAHGNLFAGLDQAELRAGATFWNQLISREVDIDAVAGTSVLYKVGLQVVQTRQDVVAGSLANYAVSVANQSAGSQPGWGYAYTIGSALGVWPMAAIGTLIGAPSTTLGGPAYAAANGVDFSNVTFSGSAFKSPGFGVDGTGAISTVSNETWTSTAAVPFIISRGQLFGTLGAGAISAAAHTFNVDADRVDASAPGGMRNGYFGYTIGGPGAKGDRNNLEAFMSLPTPSSNIPGVHYYVGFASTVQASANDNGTAGTLSSSLWGSNLVVNLRSGATFYRGIIGQEIDLEARTGSSLGGKLGMSIVKQSQDAVAGINGTDTVFAIADQVGASVGWDMGITFGYFAGIWSMNPTSTLIGTTATLLGGPAYTAAYGVDFSAVTFGQAAFKSNAFSVTQAGIVTGSAFKAGATAGVTCSGTPTALFTSSGGIVTHC
jgi:hypothetical protein